MEIKGSAVKSIAEFVRKNHSENYQAWLDSLPEQSKKIFTEPVLPSNWYPVNDAAVIPTKQLADFFFEKDIKKGAWESGRFSAEMALTGLYKFFVMAASPFFIISRAGKILSTYYRPAEIEVHEKGSNWVTVHFTNFGEPNYIVECRICGWIERALEISGANSVEVNIRKSMAKGDTITELYITWN